MLYFNGLPDYDEMQFMAHYLRAGDDFLDIGANIGTYTLYAASLVSGGRIDAFEPGEKARARLINQIKANDLVNIHVWSYALSNQEGMSQFAVTSDTTNHLVMENEAPMKMSDVYTKRLDDCCSSQVYSMGKIDIEGAEPLALAGAESMLKAQNPPVWLLEVNGCLHHYGYTEEGLSNWLRERGYRMALYDAGTGNLRFPERPWEERPNVLALAEEHLGFVESRLNEKIAS